MASSRRRTRSPESGCKSDKSPERSPAVFDRLVEDSIQRRRLKRRAEHMKEEEEAEKDKKEKKIKKQHFLDLYSRLMTLEKKK